MLKAIDSKILEGGITKVHTKSRSAPSKLVVVVVFCWKELVFKSNPLTVDVHPAAGVLPESPCILVCQIKKTIVTIVLVKLLKV